MHAGGEKREVKVRGSGKDGEGSEECVIRMRCWLVAVVGWLLLTVVIVAAVV